MAHLPAGSRSPALDQLCAGDNALRSELDSLLRAADGAGGFLETPAAEQAHALPRPAIPLRLGAYEVEREIGEGGMGTVLLAHRADGGFRQKVAIKLIRSGMDHDLLRRRFITERQILAELEHPFIARLYDGGATEDGRPYFVMEYVEGETLLAFCDARKLSVAERLHLFQRVCSAVQYAHQRLVVHRDLKPSNVLVTADGMPKLLDFGLAKLLINDQAGGAADPTILGATALTPEYASPEQVLGQTITAASDVYSLGVMLYELLTGRRPYEIRSHLQGDIERAVCTTVPPRPSTVVGRGEVETTAAGGASPDLLSARRDATPAKLRRHLAGDLDNIVLKALRKEPERRYASVEQLSQDIRRHLEGLPVEARPDTVTYRTRKFVRRHAVGVSFGAILVLSIATLIAFYTSRLAQERDRARLEAEKARQVSSFLTSLFELSDLDRTRGVKLGARELVDRGAARVEKELAGQPEVEASMLTLMGRLYGQLDLKPQARPLLEKALALRRLQLGERNPEVAIGERDLALLLHSMGDEKGAEKLLDSALAVQEASGADLEVARTLTLLGNVRKNTGNYAAANAAFERAIGIEERGAAAAEPDLAKTLNNYGLELLASGQPAKGIPLFKRSLEIQQRRLGPESPSAFAALLNLGAALRETGDVDTAIANEQRALELAEKNYGRQHGDYASALTELASSALAKRDMAKARELYTQAIALFEALNGPDHQSTLSQHRSLGIVMIQTGDAAGALAEFSRVLAGRQRAYGPDHPRVAESLLDVARARLKLGDAREAESSMRSALEIYRRKLPSDSLQLAEGLDVLGEFLCGHQKAAEGQSILKEAVRVERASLPENDPDLVSTVAALDHCSVPAAGSGQAR